MVDQVAGRHIGGFFVVNVDGAAVAGAPAAVQDDEGESQGVDGAQHFRVGIAEHQKPVCPARTKHI